MWRRVSRASCSAGTTIADLVSRRAAESPASARTTCQYSNDCRHAWGRLAIVGRQPVTAWSILPRESRVGRAPGEADLLGSHGRVAAVVRPLPTCALPHDKGRQQAMEAVPTATKRFASRRYRAAGSLNRLYPEDDRRSRCEQMCATSVGFEGPPCDSRAAAAPVTCGAAMEVPDRLMVAVVLGVPSGQDVDAGGEQVKAGPVVGEGRPGAPSGRWLPRSTPRVAGLGEAVQASVLLLPAATATVTPSAMRAFTASSTSGWPGR